MKLKKRKPNSPKSAKKFSFREVLTISIAAFGIGSIIPYSEVTSHQESIPIIKEESQELTVCFSPNLRCQQKIISSIKSAKKSIHLQAYSFTDPLIAEALIAAKDKGIEVEIILDKSNKSDSRSKVSLVVASGVPVYIDSPSGIAHNKVIVIDSEKVITGSYNFSAAAYKRNAENLLEIKNTQLAQEYLNNWEHRKTLSLPFSNDKSGVVKLFVEKKRRD